MRAPARIETARLVLAPPTPADATVIFSRYAADPDVTRHLGWLAHRSVADTREFVAFSEAQWAAAGVGPYLIRARSNGTLLGGTGLAAEDAGADMMTGYVLARDAWGRGYATEALGAMIDVARALRVRQLVALCHAEHRPSRRVLEKCGFSRDPQWTGAVEFPNLEPGMAQPTLRYVRPIGA